MPINIRQVDGVSLGADSFGIVHSNRAILEEDTEQTFVSFLNSSTRFIEQVALKFSLLRAGLKEGGLAYVEEAEGTAWLPYSLGGTYYPKGWYVWDEGSWISSKSNVAETLDALGSGSGGGSSFSGDYNDLINTPTIPTDTTLSDADIAAFGYVKTDNNTQLSDADITALGYVKTDNDTQLIDSDIAAMGYVKTDTQLTDGDIGAFGYVKTDNNTQLSDADITALGYVKTDNDTQLSDADITALGYVKTDTQLSDADITALGYVKTDNDTQLSDADITALGYVKSGIDISFFQVQDDGTTGQTVGNAYLNVQGLWDTPTLTDSDFTFDATTGQLTTNAAGIIEIDTQMLAYSSLNNRVQLMVEIQKNGTTMVSDSNYATRNVTQRTGSVSIHGFKDACSIGDIYKIRVKRVGQSVSLGTVDAALGSYFSAKLYK